MLVQARTEKTGLISFLKKINVLGITSANYRYRFDEKIVKYVILYYLLKDYRRDKLRLVDNLIDY